MYEALLRSCFREIPPFKWCFGDQRFARRAPLQTHHGADVPKNVSEDCLNLNIYMPMAATNTSKYPVMLFFFGGAFEEGSNQGPFAMYDGSYIAGSKPVIVVTANYRLGALGFLAVGP